MWLIPLVILRVWVVAIIHVIGTINFLFDKGSEPYVNVDEINDFF